MLVLKSVRERSLSLASRLRSIRLAKGWSQAELAHRAGLSLGTYRLFEQEGTISLERLIKVADVLGCADELDRLFSDEHGKVPSVEEILKPKPQRGRTSFHGKA